MLHKIIKISLNNYYILQKLIIRGKYGVFKTVYKY